MTIEFLLHLISRYLLGLRKSISKDFELNTQTPPTTRRLPHAVSKSVIAIKNSDVREIEVIRRLIFFFFILYFSFSFSFMSRSARRAPVDGET